MVATLSVTMPRLVREPLVARSPIATEISDERRRLRRIARGLPAALLRAGRTRDPSPIVAAAVDLLEAEQALFRRLALLGHAPVADHWGGLAPDSPYPSYRCSAANRGQVAPFVDACAVVRSAAAPSAADAPVCDPPALAPHAVDAPAAGSPTEATKATEATEATDRTGPTTPWATQIGALIWPTAVIDAAGDLYTGHAAGEFVALHADGSVKWRLSDPQMMYVDSTGALGRDGALYLASTDVDPRGHQNQGRVWKVDPATGSTAWTFWTRHFEDPESDPDAHLSGFLEGNVALGEEQGRVTLYAGCDDNRLYKLDADGALLWEYDTDAYPAGVIWTKPLLSPDGATVYIGDLSGQVHAVRTADGERRWVTPVGGAVVSSPALGSHGQVIFGCFDGKVYCLDAADGEVLWTYQTLGLVYSSPAIDEGARGDQAGDILIGSSDGGLYRLDRFGRRRWTYWSDAPIKSSPSLDADGCAYVGNQNGKLYAIGPDGRRRWSFATRADLADNDLNASPSIGRDGTVYIGSTSGEQFAVPAGWCEQHGDDPRVDLTPGDDAPRPAIEPGGGTLVHLDRRGTPCFEPPEQLGVHENLNLALIALDAAGDVVDARLDPDGLRVRISPELPLEVRVESMGRFVYIVPGDLLRPDTEYHLSIAGSYFAAGERRALACDVRARTAPTAPDPPPPLSIHTDHVDAVVLYGARVAVPKEIDALGQAMIDSQNFVVAPLHVDVAHRRMLVAVCWVLDSGNGSFQYRPATVNKMIGTVTWQDGGLHVEGGIRIIAQGINIPFERVRFAARATATADGPRWSEVVATLRASVADITEFADLIRVMGLADEHDDVVGFVTFSAAPHVGDEVRRPPGTRAMIDVADGVVTATITGLVDPRSHWLHLDLYDPASGRLLATTTHEATGGDGATTISTAVPGESPAGTTVAVVTVDLFPLAHRQI